MASGGSAALGGINDIEAAKKIEMAMKMAAASKINKPGQ
jgi:F0F1-type ATP synthase gamma subunit